MIVTTDLQTFARLPHPAGLHRLQQAQQIYWLKVAGEEKTNVLRRLSRRLAQWPPLQLFKVNSVLNAVERLQLEIQHTQFMYRLGLPVPEVIDSGQTYMLTRDAGLMLTKLQLDTVSLHKVLLKTFSELARLHQAGCYHGRPALRDIVLDTDYRLNFIDLEESGIDHNAILMARDVFLLLMDINRLPQINQEQQQVYIQHWQARAPIAAVQALPHIYQVLKHLSGLARLVLRFKTNQTARDYLNALQQLQPH